MADITSRSRGAIIGLVYNLHHIAISMLHQIREEHRIAGYDQEASTSHGPSFRPPVSSTSVRMQPIRGRGRERVDRRGRGRDGGQGHGRDSEGGCRTLESTLPTFIPLILTHHSILPYFPTLTHHQILLCPIDLHITFYTPRHLQIFTISGVARVSLHNSRYTLSSHPSSSPTLPPIDETMVDLVSELSTLPARRPRAPHISRVLHPSAPSAP